MPQPTTERKAGLARHLSLLTEQFLFLILQSEAKKALPEESHAFRLAFCCQILCDVASAQGPDTWAENEKQVLLAVSS